MSYRFDRSRGLIVVRAKISGPSRRVRLRLALDTGSNFTVVNTAALVSAGYDPAVASEHVEVTTASGVVFVPCFTVERFSAIGIEKTNFRILAHTLPPSASVDGLLGLDFISETVLTIDFLKELIVVR